MSQSNTSLNPAVGKLESLPQSIVAYGREMPKGELLPFHQHQRAQLVYASQGVMSVTTHTASYIVPPQRAVWMPEHVEHQIEALSDVSMRTLYIDTNLPISLPGHACILQVSPLLRELIITAVAQGTRYEEGTPQSRIMSVILDQIGELPIVSLALPMPQDDRLLKITSALIKEPANQQNLECWARQVGASKRTLSRLFNAELGMSFTEWRQQRRIHRAIELLSAGLGVTTIAQEVGYENTSAFIAVFKRCLGTTPSNYLS
ncbi:MAG: helix-turn-helix transcriptional regulator [Sedimenticola sp.]